MTVRGMLLYLFESTKTTPSNKSISEGSTVLTFLKK